MFLKIKKVSAFSLMEMSVCIVILGFAFTGYMGYQGMLLSGTQKQRTTEKLNIIDSAIMAFFIKNDRLPCPTNIEGSNNGNEERGNNDCVYTYGGIPYKDLSLSSEYALDSWNRQIVYIVKNEQLFIVKTTNSDKPLITDKVLYALISTGENKNGAFKSNGVQDSLDTSAPDANNTKSGFNNSSSIVVSFNGLNETFDDIVVYKTYQQFAIETKNKAIGCYGNNGKYYKYGEEMDDATIDNSGNSYYTPSSSGKPRRKCLSYGVWSDILYEYKTVECNGMPVVEGNTNIMPRYSEGKKRKRYTFEYIDPSPSKGLNFDSLCNDNGEWVVVK